MDTTLPRGASRIRATFLFLLGSSSCSTTTGCAAILPLNHRNIKIIITHSLEKPTAIFSPQYSHKMSESNMEKFPHDTAEAAKDQLREGCRPSKRISDGLLPHILNLYASRATPEDFEIYAPHATFEDPLMFANGVKQIKSAFYSLAKIFSESRIVDYSIEENIISPGKAEILIDNKQYYKLLGKDINMISLIRLLTEDGKVVRHEDWWDRKPLSNRDTAPFVGRINEATRRVSMFVTHAFMRFGKDPTV